MIKEYKANIWDYKDVDDYRICIPINGSVNSKGEAVMGRGLALQATSMFLGIKKSLGTLLTEKPFTETDGHLYFGKGLVFVPVKFKWNDKASLLLIHSSLHALCDHVREFRNTTYLVPRLGCGNGGLDWLTQVKPLFEQVDKETEFPPNLIVVNND